MMKSKFYLFTVCVLMGCLSGQAQEFRALISGIVRDGLGASVAGASVSVKNVDTNLVVTVVSAPDGAYFIPQLPIGTYELNAEARGFKRYTREGIVLSIGQKAIADVQMTIGDVTQTVEVTAALSGIESDESVVAETLSNKTLVDTPFGGRNFINDMQLVPGVLGEDSINSVGDVNSNGRDMNFEVQGGRPNANLYTMDGVSQGLQGGSSYIPLEDAIEQTKIATPSSDASYALSGGGVVSLSMKSGTNRFHGLVSEYFENEDLNAYTTQQKVNPALTYRKNRYNLYNGMLNGPIIKDKLFFSTFFEGEQTLSATPTNVTVPTLLQRQGDFSQTFNAQGKLITIYDPLSTTQVGSTYVRTPFPGNKIPASRINAIAANLLAMDPAPNYVYNSVTNANNYFVANNPSTSSFVNYYGKGDYVWNDRNRTAFTFARSARTGYSATGNGILRPNPLLSVNGDPIQRQHEGAFLDHVATLNSTTVLTVRAAWDFWVEKVFGTTQFNYDGTKLGYTGVTGLEGVGFPTVSFQNFASWGNSQDDMRPKTDYELSADVSKTINRHFLRVGVRAAQIREEYAVRGNFLGALSFTPAFTQANPQQADTTSGSDMASLLLGYPQSGGVDNNAKLAFRMDQVGLYVQDDFRVSKKLILNLGLRWDLQTPQGERSNREDVGFDPTSSYTLGGATASGSILFAGGKYNTPFNAHYADFSPRVGVGYGISKNLIFRAGYGISYLPMDAYRSGTGIEDPGLTAGYAINTPYVPTIGGGVNAYTPGQPGASTFANPFPNGIQLPQGAALGPSALVGNSITVRDRDYRPPFVQQYHLGFEYDLPLNTTIEASYAGSHTRDIAVSNNINFLSNSNVQLGVANPSYLNAAVPNPFFGAPQLTGTTLASSTITKAQSLLPFPQFTGVTETAIPVGYSSYDAFETRLNTKFSRGFSTILVYTFAKALEATTYLNPQNTNLDHEVSAWDRPSNLDIAGAYELPVGRGKRFGSNMNPILDEALGGWRANAIFVYLAGTPILMPAGAIRLRNPALPNGQQKLTHYFDTCTLLANGTRTNCTGDEAATFQQLSSYQLAVSSVYSPDIRSPSTSRSNLSLSKTFRVTDTFKAEFRANEFNLFNNKLYGSPNTTLTNSLFGQVATNTQVTAARTTELVLRILF
jgi:hypothetical protein